MSSTIFVNGVTLTDAEWFNDTDDLVYDAVIRPNNSAFNVTGSGDEAAGLATMLAAATGQLIIMDPGKTYTSSTDQTLPTGATLDLNGSTLNFTVDGAVKNLIVSDGTTVRNGTLKNTGTNPAGSGQFQLPINVGDYTTGVGVSDVTIENLTMDNNRPDGLMIGIWGSSNNIKIDNITVGDNANIGAVVDAEWGGNIAGTLTHPNNLSIRNIKTGALSRTDASVVYLAGAVQTLIENIYATETDKAAVIIYAGDYGLSKASTNIKALGFGGITVRNARCDSASTRGGVYIDMQAGISLEIYDCDGMLIESSGSHGASITGGAGITVVNARGVEVRDCFGTNHSVGLSVGQNVERLKVKGGRYWLNNEHGVSVANGTVAPNYCLVDGVLAYGNGVGGGNKAGIYVQNGTGNEVKNCTLGRAAEATQIYGVRVDIDALNTVVVDNHCIDCKDGGVAFSLGSSTSFVTKRVKGNTSGAIGGGGQIFDGPNPIIVDTEGRGNTLPNNQSRVLYGTAAPGTGTWAVGDRWIQSTPVVGQPTGGMCTVAGTPGTWVNQANL